MKIILIAALNLKRVIGNDGKIPWHLPEDLKRFKNITTGHTILMGRKTFESLGRTLPNRRNVVITKSEIPNIETYNSIEIALENLKNEEKVFVIGGGEIYSQMLSKADEIYLTIVENNLNGDTFFPEYKDLIDKKYKLVFEEKHDGYTFQDFIKQ